MLTEPSIVGAERLPLLFSAPGRKLVKRAKLRFTKIPMLLPLSIFLYVT